MSDLFWTVVAASCLASPLWIAHGVRRARQDRCPCHRCAAIRRGSLRHAYGTRSHHRTVR